MLLKDQGKPVEVVYPAEGSPLIIVPLGVFRGAPNPNAAKLFRSFFFSVEAQTILVDVFGPPLVPRTGEGEGRARAAGETQADEGRSHRGAGTERGDQGALCQAVRGIRGAFSGRVSAATCGSGANPGCRCAHTGYAWYALIAQTEALQERRWLGVLR